MATCKELLCFLGTSMFLTSKGRCDTDSTFIYKALNESLWDASNQHLTMKTFLLLTLISAYSFVLKRHSLVGVEFLPLLICAGTCR